MVLTIYEKNNEQNDMLFNRFQQEKQQRLKRKGNNNVIPQYLRIQKGHCKHIQYSADENTFPLG